MKKEWRRNIALGIAAILLPFALFAVGTQNDTSRLALANLAIYVWNYLTSLTAKTTLVDADQIGISDSAASNAGKKITWANLMVQAAGYSQTLTNKTLTTPTIASFVNATHDHTSAASGGAITRYVLYGQTSNEAPADSTTYYFGAPLRASITTTATQRKIYIPYAGTITRVDTTVYLSVGGTSGSSETSTLYMRLNNTTDTTLSSSIVCNQTAAGAPSYFSATGLSVAVVAGDYVELKWTTPAWTTNPLSIHIQCQIFVS